MDHFDLMMDEFGDPHLPLIPAPRPTRGYYSSILLAPLSADASGGSQAGVNGAVPMVGAAPLIAPVPAIEPAPVVAPAAQAAPAPAIDDVDSDTEEAQTASAPINLGSQAYLVSRFMGDSSLSVEDFIESVSLAKFLSGWTDPQTLAVARLRLGGMAAEHVRANSSTAGSSWVALKRELRSRFGTRVPRYAMEQKFITCIQKKGESAAEYATRLQLLGSELKRAMSADNGGAKIPEATIADRVLHQFLAGLRRELRRFVLVRGPKSLTAAIEAAQAEEAASEPVSYGVRNTDIDVRAVEAALAELALRKPPPTVPTVNYSHPPPPMPVATPPPPQNPHRQRNYGPRRNTNNFNGCYCCGGQGHMAYECPMVICGLCKQSGHNPRNCPSKSDGQYSQSKNFSGRPPPNQRR